MKNWMPFSLIAIIALSFSLAGCMNEPYPGYSSGVKYGLRTDPVLRGVAATLGDERFDPDRPGMLPVMKFDEIFNPEHPYYPKIKQALETPLQKIIEEKKGKDAKLTDEERKKLEEQIITDHANYKTFYVALDKTLRNPVLVKDRADFETALESTFGTPLKPTIKNADINPMAIEQLKLDDKTLAEGSAYYRVHCMHCHGVPGDGRGPTARWINPHPRDFREGKFKFMSVNQVKVSPRPPARADLLRTLRHGIEGTAMPSFNLLNDHELEALVSYVIFLSVRGNTEFNIIKGNMDLDKDGNLICMDAITGDPLKIEEAVKKAVRNLLTPNTNLKPEERADWLSTQHGDAAIQVPSYPDDPNDADTLKASVQRGIRLFNAKPSEDPKVKAAASVSCASCHENYGRQAKFRFDDWGSLVRPNNFTLGVFRGGRRPVDLYYRIHSGINGSNMPSFGASLKDRQIWDLVNFVSTLTYPGMRSKLGINIDEVQ
jgi:mono/diheme cytochrome c family protein